MPQPKLGVALYEYERCLETAARIHSIFRKDATHRWDSIYEGLPATTAQKIIGLAFVGVIAGWEDFLESAFLRYMVGGLAPNGYAPRLRLGPCSSIRHARQVLGGTVNLKQASKRCQWSDYQWVEETAGLFFVGGGPFTFRSPILRKRLNAAFAIRNRIVHNSEKAKKKFKEVCNDCLGKGPGAPLDHGFTPGKLLTIQGGTNLFNDHWVEANTYEWGDLFEAYVAQFYGVSGLIVPL